MKNIKDYLHLYLGCDFEWTNGIVTHQYKLMASWITMIEANDWWGDVKPILRPLSDMTEEEAYEVDSEYGSVSGQHLSQALINNDLRYVKKLADGFELTRYLLSKHFDLFGLIEAGLANRRD